MIIDESSLKISQLKRLRELKQSDELFFSNLQINFTDNESKRISFQNMVNTLTEDIQNTKQFGTMMTESDSSYAKCNHIHDYSYTTAKSYYQLSDSNELTNLIGTISLSSNGTEEKIQIWLTNTKYDTMDEKYIGEVRMINSSKLNTRQQILDDISKGNFDGWVYADGYTYEMKMGKYDFSTAYQKMKNDGKGKFQVPDLRNFFKCNSSITYDSIKEMEANTILPKHSHDITQKDEPIYCDVLTEKIDVNVKVLTYTTQKTNQPSTGIILAASNSTKNTENDTTKINAKCSFSEWFYQTSGRKMIENKTQYGEREQYPTHIILIPMVWIGTQEVK